MKLGLPEKLETLHRLTAHSAPPAPPGFIHFFEINNIHINKVFFSRPGQSQGLIHKQLVLKLKYLYGAVTTKELKMVLPVVKQILLTFYCRFYILKGI